MLLRGHPAARVIPSREAAILDQFPVLLSRDGDLGECDVILFYSNFEYFFFNILNVREQFV